MIRWNYVLIAILVLGGGWLVYEIDRLDREYNSLLNDGIHELKMIEHMSYNSNRRHNLFYSIMREKDASKLQKEVEEWKRLKTINTYFFDTILNLNHESESHQLVREAQEVRKSYNDYCDRQLEKITSNQNADQEMDFEKFDLLFEQYQEKVNDLFLAKHRIMKSSSENLATKVDSRIRNILLFVFSPVIVGLCFIACMFLAFRFFYSKGKAYY